MFLGYTDLVGLFPDFKGIKEANHQYFTVSDHSGNPQPRGLYIPIKDNSGDLLEAISNGAIAAIWDEKKQVPKYTPNHFPVFLTDDPVEAVRRILKYYLEKVDGDNREKMNLTNFVFLNKKLLKENEETYDIARMLEKISKRYEDVHVERRG